MRSRTIFLICSLIMGAVLVSATPSCTPSQVHLSLGDIYYSVERLDNLRLSSEKLNDNQAYLVWHTKDVCKQIVQINEVENKAVVFKNAPDFFNNFERNFTSNSNTSNSSLVQTSHGADQHNMSYHTVVYTSLLKNLAFEKVYEYSIHDEHDAVVSGPFKFKLADPKLTNSSRKILLVGNLDDKARGKGTIDAISNLMRKDNDKYAGIIQIGGIANDLQDINGTNGDNFFNSIQPYSSITPLVFASGSREAFDSYSLFDLRVRNPLFNTTHNKYFSFDLQGIHFVSLDLDFYTNSNTQNQHEIDSWMQRDLALANDDKHRKVWPWIVFIASKPIYCLQNGNSDTQCGSYYAQSQKWDELLHKYKVDLVISANVSAYQRLGPIYQNKGVDTNSGNNHELTDSTIPTYIIEGAGGNSHSNPSLYAAAGFAKFVDVRPGYGALYVQNNSNNIQLIYEHYESGTGTKVDFLTLTKTRPPTTGLVDSKKNDVSNGIHHNVFVRMVLPIILLIGAIAGFYLWRRRRVVSDPERSMLSTKEYKSSRIYGNRPNRDSTVSMVDLVL